MPAASPHLSSSTLAPGLGASRRASTPRCARRGASSAPRAASQAASLPSSARASPLWPEPLAVASWCVSGADAAAAASAVVMGPVLSEPEGSLLPSTSRCDELDPDPDPCKRGHKSVSSTHTLAPVGPGCCARQQNVVSRPVRAPQRPPAKHTLTRSKGRGCPSSA